MSVDKGIVIEGISVQSLGYKSSSHSTWSPFLKFEIGSNVHKTSTLKHVPAGQDLVWQGETLRFPANAGDMLTITALHRRTLFHRSKKFIGDVRLAVADLRGKNKVTLKSSSNRNAGDVSFSIEGVVPLATVAEVAEAREKATADLPKHKPTTDALATEEGSNKASEPSPELLAAVTQTTTTRSKRTTTTTITDTAHILHQKAPEQDAEAHMLIEAGKQKLLEDQDERRLARRPAQGESVMLTFGVLCKLLLASYLAFLDVIVTRTVELMGRPNLAPRRLLQMDTPPSRASYKSRPPPAKVPSILQKSEAEVLELPGGKARGSEAAAEGMPIKEETAETGRASTTAATTDSPAAEADAEPSTPQSGIVSKFAGTQSKVEDSAQKSHGALKSAGE